MKIDLYAKKIGVGHVKIGTVDVPDSIGYEYRMPLRQPIEVIGPQPNLPPMPPVGLPITNRLTPFECVNCHLAVNKLSRDHIVPMWFVNRVNFFGVTHAEIIQEIEHYKPYRSICIPCNMEKSGNIVYRDPIVCAYMTQFLLLIGQKILDQEGPRKLHVNCECKLLSWPAL